MRIKDFYLSMQAIMMAMLLSVSFTACGSDDDESDARAYDSRMGKETGTCAFFVS